MARKTGLKGLQEWAKHVTQGYRDVEITNMTTSFKSGLAFCAIIHRYRPELIPYNELKKENVLGNNKLAFSVAESELDIPALLDAEDMVALTVPDKLSIATYLSQYYNYFKDKQPAFGKSGVKVQASTEPAPSPKRTKLENTKTVSSPSLPLKEVENTAVTAPPSRPSPPQATTQPAQSENSIRRGRKSKFDKPEATPTDEGKGTLKRGTMGKEECEVCGQRVFLMERLGVENRVFHRACFKCSVCSVALKPSSYEHDAKSGKFYCQQHYRETMRQQTIKRTMAERGLSPSDLAETSSPIKPKKSKNVQTDPGESKAPAPVASKDSSKPESVSAVTESRPVLRSKVTSKSKDHLLPVAANEAKKELTHSGEMKAGLPSLLKSLATSKQQKESTTASKQNTSVLEQQGKTPQDTTVSPSKQDTTVSPSKQDTTVSPSKQSTTVSPSKQSTTVSPSKQSTTVSPSKQDTTVSPSKQSTTVSPTKQDTTVSPSKQSATVSPSKQDTTVSPSKQHTTVTTVSPSKQSATVTQSTSEAVSKRTISVTTGKQSVSVKEEIQARSVGPGKQRSDQTHASKTVSEAVEPTKPPRMSRAAKTSQLEQPTPKPAAGIVPSKPPPPSGGIQTKPPPPYVSPWKPAEPAASKPNEPVKSTKAVITVESKKPALSGSTPITPVTSATPAKPPRRKKIPVPSSEKSPEIPSKQDSIRPKRPAPPRPAPPSHPSQPSPRPTRPPSQPSPHLTRPSQPLPRPTRPSQPSPRPTRPSQPPTSRQTTSQPPNGGGGVDLRLLTEKRKRRVGALRRQLEDVEREQERMEERGVTLEQQLREKGDEAEDHLIEEWFTLVNDKNMLLRQESDLVYELKDLELIDQHEALDNEIRRRLTKDDSLKTEVERLEEEAMISELVELVERRDKLLWTLHLEKTLDEEEDRQVELMTSTQVRPKPVQRYKSSFM